MTFDPNFHKNLQYHYNTYALYIFLFHFYYHPDDERSNTFEKFHASQLSNVFSHLRKWNYILDFGHQKTLNFENVSGNFHYSFRKNKMSHSKSGIGPKHIHIQLYKNGIGKNSRKKTYKILSRTILSRLGRRGGITPNTPVDAVVGRGRIGGGQKYSVS